MTSSTNVLHPDLSAELPVREAVLPQEEATRLFVAAAFLIAILFLAGTLGRTYHKLLWMDEIITVSIAALPVGDMWTALRDGVDLSPPGFQLLLRVSQAIFGDGLLGSRMHAALGMLCAALLAGVYVRRRYGACAGLSAMLLLLCTDAYFYAYEARPYGAVLGFTAAALVCWQAATSRAPRGIWLAGLFASLAGAVACHYYAVLVLAPFAAGELSRFVARRRPDWPLWIALACSTFPLIISFPLLRTASQFSDGYFAYPSLRTVLDSYELTVSALAVPLVAAFVVSGGTVVFAASDRRGHTAASSVAQHEWVIAAALVLLPGLAYLLALFWTRALAPRYYLAWTVGLSILAPMTIARLSPHWRRVMATSACLLFVWFGARQVQSARLLVHEGPNLKSMYPLLFDEGNGSLPIVIGHPHVYLTAFHYSSPAIQSRLVTLTPPTGVQTTSNTAFRSLRALSELRPLRVEEFDRFIARHERFLVYGPSSTPVLDWLRTAGAVLVLRGEDQDTQMFPMSNPGPYFLFEVTLAPAVAGLQSGF
jgi:hypothetical protein